MTGRVAGITALLVVVVATAWVLMRDDDYRVHVRFADAGQLVEGGDVHVAGRRVGTIAAIRLADGGGADVEVRITDADLTPLTASTRADIRAVGQAGVANRVVDLTPGSARTAAIPDGGVLPVTQTSGIVNIDQLVGVFDDRTRKSMRALFARGNEVFAGSGAPAFSSMLHKLAPALHEVATASRDLSADGAQLTRLVRTARDTATALADRRPELESAIDSSARWLSALADERESVSDALRDAPAVLEQSRGTLARAEATVRTLQPALRQVPPMAPALAEVVRGLPGTLQTARPVARELTRQLPELRRGLDEASALEGPMRALLGSTASAVGQLRPILGPARMYAPDLILGVINGLAGVAVGSYDASGHYARLAFVQPPQTLLGGSLAGLLTKNPLLPGVFDQKIRQTRRCPGGALPPAPDGSNVDVAGEPLCDPSQSMQEHVNRP